VMAGKASVFAVVGVVTFLFVIIGGGAPYWDYSESDSDPTNTQHSSPFTACILTTGVNTDDCVRINPGDLNDKGRALQCFTLLAIIISLVNAILIPAYGCCGKDRIRVPSGLLALLAALCGIIATGIFVSLQPNQKCQKFEFQGGSGDNVTFYTCYWGFALFVVGWVFNLLNGAGVLSSSGGSD